MEHHLKSSALQLGIDEKNTQYFLLKCTKFMRKDIFNKIHKKTTKFKY